MHIVTGQSVCDYVAADDVLSHYTLHELAGDSYDWQLAAKCGHSVAVVQTTKFYNSVCG